MRRRAGPRWLDPHQISKVNTATILQYQRAAGRFVTWMVANNFLPTDIEELDDALIEFKADTGPSKSHFQNTVASVEFTLPAARGQLRWTRAVLAGWNASHVPKHTTPVSQPLTRLIGVYLVSRRHPPSGDRHGAATAPRAPAE